MFYDPAAIGFVARLERSWREFHADFLRIREDLRDWHETKLCESGWKVFGVFDFPHGEPIAPNVERCRFTAEFIRNEVPDHGAVGFSVLQPQTRIKPHVGYAGPFLRCHLGLRVPAGDCALRVDGATRGWETGRAMVFDDRLEHEAWNLTGEERVVLLFDFVPRGESRQRPNIQSR